MAIMLIVFVSWFMGLPLLQLGEMKFFARDIRKIMHKINKLMKWRYLYSDLINFTFTSLQWLGPEELPCRVSLVPIARTAKQ